MSKILKNTTGSIIEIRALGLEIPASSQITIEITDYLLLGSDDSVTELTSLINSGDIVINDGVSDLSIADGLAYIEYPDDAANIRFDNSSNGFTSDDAQSAIEEAQDNVDRKANVLFKWAKPGTVLPEDFLFSFNRSSNDTGQLVPFDGFLTKLNIINKVNIGNKIVEVVRRRPCFTGTLTVIATGTISGACGVLDINAAVLAEDEIGVRLSSSSVNAEDIEVTAFLNNNSTNQIGGSFLQTEDEGISIEDTTTSFNFTGAGVTATSDGNGNVTVDITGGGAGSGEVNTASNIGAGEGVFAQKNSVDLEFKSLVAGSNVTINSDADEITIAAAASGEANTASNIGAGEDIFIQKTGVDLEFRGISGTTGITASTNSNTIEIALDNPPDLDVNKIAQAVDTAGQSVSTSGFANLSFDTFLSASGVATANASGITINKDGLYEISYNITNNGGSTSRSKSQARLFLNGSTVINGSIGGMYHRTTTQSEGAASVTVYQQLSNTDTITLQSQRTAGGAPISTVANSTLISVKYLRSSN